MACEKGFEDIARLLLEHGADLELEVEFEEAIYVKAVEYTSKTPLQVAVCAGHLPIIQLLINAEANVNHFNSHGTALSIASKKNDLDVAVELINSGAFISDPSGR